MTHARRTRAVKRRSDERAGGIPWTGFVAAAAGVFILLYLLVAAMRAAYPWELEWLEGAMLEQSLRVLGGAPLYLAPSLGFVPFNYTPLFAWAGAPFVALFGERLMALRLLSILASLAALAAMAVLVRRETRSTAAGLLAAGLFAATYRLGGSWLDLARPDSLHLALILAGAVAARLDGTPVRGPVIAAALWTLAFLTKQSALVAVAPLIAWLLWRDRRRGLILAAALATLAGASVLALNAASAGWFGYYAFEVARRHPADPALAWRFLANDVLAPLWPGLLLVAAALRRRAASWAPGFHWALAAGLFGCSAALRLYPGGHTNVLLPACAAFAVIGALAFHALAEAPGRRPGWTPALATLLVLIQLVVLRWDPIAALPRPGDRAAGDSLVALLRERPGRVLVSSHSWLAGRAGKPPHAHVMALMDVVKGGDGPVETGLWRAMCDSLAAHTWETLVLDTRDWLAPEAMRAGYRVERRVVHRRDVGWPMTGMKTRPEYLLVPPDSTRAVP